MVRFFAHCCHLAECGSGDARQRFRDQQPSHCSTECVGVVFHYCVHCRICCPPGVCETSHTLRQEFLWNSGSSCNPSDLCRFFHAGATCTSRSSPAAIASDVSTSEAGRLCGGVLVARQCTHSEQAQDCNFLVCRSDRRDREWHAAVSNRRGPQFSIQQYSNISLFRYYGGHNRWLWRYHTSNGSGTRHHFNHYACWMEYSCCSDWNYHFRNDCPAVRAQAKYPYLPCVPGDGFGRERKILQELWRETSLVRTRSVDGREPAYSEFV